MRLFAELLVLWTLVSILAGVSGRFWLEETWRDQTENAFRQSTEAAAFLVANRLWNEPVESDPQWGVIERNLRLRLIPLRGSAQSLSSAESDAEEVAVRRDKDLQSFPDIEWESSAGGISRLSLNLALPPGSEVGDVDYLRITSEVEANRLGHMWWLSWGLMTVCAYSMGLIGILILRREKVQRRRILRPWFQAFREAGQRPKLLPRTEAQDSDFSVQIDSVADSINRLYSELRNENERAELVLGNLREGVLAVDEKSRVLLANRAFRRLMELQETEYLYRPLIEMIRTPVITTLVRRTLSEQTPAEEEIEFGESQRQLRILARPLPLGPERSGALLTVRDQTLIKRVDMIKKDFVANASHELKTPLAAIRAYAETLQMGALGDEDAAEDFVNNIVAQADRMDGLVQGMLQLSRVEVGAAMKIRRFEALEAIQPCVDASRALARGKGIQVKLESEAEEIWIRSDRDGLQTIVGNLMSNAVRYTESGGAVIAKLTETDEELCIEVRDTGIGLKNEDVDRVFERFYRAEKDRSTDSGGTGLGLSIVKHLVSALGGSVEVESELGRGSCFRVRVPVNWRSDAAGAVG
jgi:two-component system phosphate regulon sensor histidine kinase PhoR